MVQLFDLYKTAESGKAALIDDRFVLKIALSWGEIIFKRKRKCNENTKFMALKKKPLYFL